MPEQDFKILAKIEAMDVDQGLVYGWASVVEKDGVSVVDTQGDIITEEELVKAAHAFITKSRVAKVMHSGEPVGTIVESMVFTREVQKTLGIELDNIGWFIGMKVEDPAIKKAIRKGELAAFSIGGKAKERKVI